MHDQAIINKVRKLRKKGLTYFEINEKLRISILKNTLSYWCKDIVLPIWYKDKIEKINKLNLIKARTTAIRINKIKRKKFLLSLKEKNSHLLKKTNIPFQKLLLSVLYLGEGAKYGRSSTLTLGSSNHLIIKLYLKLLKNSFAMDDTKFRVRIQCRFDQSIKDLENYWENIKQNKGCSYCAGKKVGLSNCLATKNPELAKQWHPTKNGDLTPYDVTCGSGKNVWWQCSKNPKHEWNTDIDSRVYNNNGCPYCCGQLPSDDYNLLFYYPELCDEWDYIKNKKNPEEYTPKSGQKVWWKCKKCNKTFSGGAYYLN